MFDTVAPCPSVHQPVPTFIGVSLNTWAAMYP